MTHPDSNRPANKTYKSAERRTKYCVIIGVLNENPKIVAQLQKMRPYLPHADVIIADGGSTDNSAEDAYATGVPRFVLVLPDAGGLSAQYRIAIGHALEDGYEGVIMMDGNNKDDPAAIPSFIGLLEAGYDMVQGSRFIKGGHHANTPLDRVLAIKLIAAPLFRLFSGFAYTDPINGFKAVSRRYLEDANMLPFRPVFKRYNLQYYLNFRAHKLGFRVTEQPVTRVYPTSRKDCSKIVGIKGRLWVMAEIVRTLAGCYNPPKRATASNKKSLLNLVRTRIIHKRRHAALVANIAPFLPPHSRVLDVGTGSGQIAAGIQQRDPSLQMAGVDVLLRPSTSIPVQPFDGVNLPYGNDSWDITLLIDVLHHARDPEALLKECLRVSSCVIIKDHLCSGRLSHLILSFMDYIGNKGTGIHQPYRYYSRREWDEMFNRLGLEVAEWKEQLGLYPPIASWVFERHLHFVAALREKP